MGTWGRCTRYPQAIALDPGYLRPFTRLAKAHCELGDFDAACHALERAAARAREKPPGKPGRSRTPTLSCLCCGWASWS